MCHRTPRFCNEYVYVCMENIGHRRHTDEERRILYAHMRDVFRRVAHFEERIQEEELENLELPRIVGCQGDHSCHGAELLNDPLQGHVSETGNLFSVTEETTQLTNQAAGHQHTSRDTVRDTLAT